MGIPTAYIWDKTARAFRDGRGRFVSPTVVREAIDAFGDNVAVELNTLAVKFRSGDINASEFAIESRKVIKSIHLASGTIAAGGRRQLTASIQGLIASRIKAEYAFFQGMIRDVESGRQALDGTFLSRVAQYAAAATPTYEAVRRKTEVESGDFDQERRVLHSVVPCGACAEYAGRGWQPIGTLPGVGQKCSCHSRCRCTFAFRKSSSYRAAPPTATPSISPKAIGGSLPPLRFALSPQQSARRSVLVMADVAKLDASLASDPGGFYVGKGGVGPSAIKGRYANARAFLEASAEDGTPVHPADVSLGPDGQAYIDDGRHRFAVLRDAGVKAVPVAVWSGQAKAFRKLYGAKGVIGMGDETNPDGIPDETPDDLATFKGGGKSGGKGKSGKGGSSSSGHGKLEGGRWATIHGHPIYIKGGKVVAGGVPGLTHDKHGTPHAAPVAHAPTKVTPGKSGMVGKPNPANQARAEAVSRPAAHAKASPAAHPVTKVTPGKSGVVGKPNAANQARAEAASKPAANAKANSHPATKITPGKSGMVGKPNPGNQARAEAASKSPGKASSPHIQPKPSKGDIVRSSAPRDAREAAVHADAKARGKSAMVVTSTPAHAAHKAAGGTEHHVGGRKVATHHVDEKGRHVVTTHHRDGTTTKITHRTKESARRHLEAYVRHRIAKGTKKHAVVSGDLSKFDHKAHGIGGKHHKVTGRVLGDGGQVKFYDTDDTDGDDPDGDDDPSVATFKGGGAKAPKAAPGKSAGHATTGKGSGGCGTGAGGFKSGNTCGHKGNRNAKVESARAAHQAAKAEVLAHVKAHRKASKVAAKSGEKAAHPKELHAALKKAAAAHGALKAARDTHRENKKAERNAARRESRAVKSGKAQPLSAKPKPPARTGQAKPPSTDKGTRNQRLAVLAARHDMKRQALKSQASRAYSDTANRLALSGKGNTHIEGKAADAAYAGAHAINRRASHHGMMANRLRDAIHDPAKSAAAGRTLKSLSGSEAGSGRNRAVIRDMGNRLTHTELRAAADHAGVDHVGKRTQQETVDHLANTVGRAKGPSLREQADAHRTARTQAMKDRESPNAARPASEFRQRKLDATRAVREQLIQAASRGRQSLKTKIASLKQFARPGSAADRGIRYGTKLLESKRLNPPKKSR